LKQKKPKEGQPTNHQVLRHLVIFTEKFSTDSKSRFWGAFLFFKAEARPEIFDRGCEFGRWGGWLSCLQCKILVLVGLELPFYTLHLLRWLTLASWPQIWFA
jgi:hypothetical protein